MSLKSFEQMEPPMRGINNEIKMGGITREELKNSEGFQVANIEYSLFDMVCSHANIESHEQSIPMSRLNVDNVKSFLRHCNVDPRKARRVLSADFNPSITDIVRIANGCGKRAVVTFEPI